MSLFDALPCNILHRDCSSLPTQYYEDSHIGLSSFNFFSGALRKTILFLREVRLGRSRASKVTDIGANRKRGCDFLS